MNTPYLVQIYYLYPKSAIYLVRLFFLKKYINLEMPFFFKAKPKWIICETEKKFNMHFILE